MSQVDLANPTLEFTDYDPSIAAEYGTSDSINYLMHSLADTLGIADNILVLPLMFLFNLLMAWLIIYCIYYKVSRRRDYYVTFMLFSSAMFLLLWLMQILDIQTGFVLGLFAIFGMIRYRTETVPIREMTYLFIIIAQAVMNSLSLHACRQSGVAPVAVRQHRTHRTGWRIRTVGSTQAHRHEDHPL